MRGAVLDIETTALGAVGAGIILLVCVRPTDSQRTRTFRIDGYDFKPSKNFGFVEREETQLLKDLTEELPKYEVLIGHNIVRFDIPYIKSRCFQRNLVMPPMVLYDTLHAFRRTNYLTVPNFMGRPSAGLDMVTDFMNIQQEKTKIYPNEWWQSVWGNQARRTESMNNIQDHCRKDVRINANVFPYLWHADPRPALKKIF